MKNPAILIVEDEIGIAQFIQEGLQEKGFLVTHCLNGESAYEVSQKQKFDLILLDWMLLGISGLDLCKLIRQEQNINGDTPIIFLTAKDTIENVVLGLESGANDYIKKPFNFQELLARIGVYIRDISPVNVLEMGNISVNLQSNEAFLSGQKVELTLREYNLLCYLFSNKNKVCDRKDIISEIWDIHYDYDTSVIEVFINALRRKLQLKKDDPRLLTVRGKGYISKDV
ncbi:response regulator transcription factor [Myroides sp. LJL116]